MLRVQLYSLERVFFIKHCNKTTSVAEELRFRCTWLVSSINNGPSPDRDAATRVLVMRSCCNNCSQPTTLRVVFPLTALTLLILMNLELLSTAQLGSTDFGKSQM